MQQQNKVYDSVTDDDDDDDSEDYRDFFVLMETQTMRRVTHTNIQCVIFCSLP